MGPTSRPSTSSSLVERHRPRLLLLAGLLAAVGLLLVVLSLTNGETSSSPPVRPADGAYIDRAIELLAATDEIAIVAEQQARRRAVRGLASDIRNRDQLVAQLLASIHQRIFARPSQRPDGSVAPHEGFEAAPRQSAERRPGRATGVDRVFLDAVLEYRAALFRAALEQGRSAQDEQLRSLARELAVTYRADIRRLGTWRKRWFSAPSKSLRRPSGGGAAAGADPRASSL